MGSNHRRAVQTDRSRNRDSFQKRISIACGLALAFLLTVLGTAAVIRSAEVGGRLFSANQSKFVISFAEFPVLVRNSFVAVLSLLSADPLHLLIDKKGSEKPSWVRKFPAADDPGYLLFSGADRKKRQSLVMLIRVSDGSTIVQWTPDWKAIYRAAGLGEDELKHAQAIHPLLMDNGDIVFNTMGSLLIRLTPCSTNPAWVLHVPATHSNELDPAGNIWTIETDNSPTDFPQFKQLKGGYTDNALLLVSPSGRIIRKISFSRVLHDNGLDALLFGANGDRPNVDPLHLNEVQPAYSDSKYWKSGDLLISSRNLSTIFLFRPSTGQVIWHQTGPWLNQHSAQFVDGHRISVFDNHTFPTSDTGFLPRSDSNHVIVHDFETGTDSEPFSRLLAEARPMTLSEGRAQLLPDGGLFLEETNLGRILRFTKERLLWSYVNDYDSGRIGVLAWSRYLSAGEAKKTVTALQLNRCTRV
jgi:hypothetical protein